MDIGTRHWIIKNENTKVFMLVNEFIKRVTPTFFHFDALKYFGITLNSKTDFFLTVKLSTFVILEQQIIVKHTKTRLGQRKSVQNLK